MAWNNRGKSLKTAFEERWEHVGRHNDLEARANVVAHASAVFGLVTFSLLLAACPQRTAVWVEQGSTPAQLTFGIGRRHGVPGDVAVGVVRVFECHGSETGPGAMWVVTPRGGTAELKHITYGTVPPGFVSEQGPRRLVPGCYRVHVSGSGKAQFDITAQGEVKELSRR